MTHEINNAITGALAGVAIGGVLVLLQVVWLFIRHGVDW